MDWWDLVKRYNVIMFVGEMGNGKTLSSVIVGQKFLSEGYEVIANFRCDGFEYNSLMLYTVDELKAMRKTVLIIDDILAYKHCLEAIGLLIASWSRKLSVRIILTGQYYTFIPRSIRMLGLTIYPFIDIENKSLFWIVARDINPIGFTEIEWNIVRDAMQKYDTREQVEIFTEYDILNALKKKCGDSWEKEALLLGFSLASINRFKKLMRR